MRRRPDVLIATPGRLIDHIHNAQSFDLSSIEVLIMDEADRCARRPLPPPARRYPYIVTA